MRTNAAKRRKSRQSTPVRSQRIPERVERALELPIGTLTQAARVELSGNRRAVIEGCLGIVEYADDTIRLNTGSGQMRFTGRSLSLSCLTQDSAVIEGHLLSIEFLS